MAEQQLVVASDIRTTLFRRALLLLDSAHEGLGEFSFGALEGDGGGTFTEPSGSGQLALVPVPSGGPSLVTSYAGELASDPGGDVLGRVLVTFVQGRSSTARRAADAVAQIHSEIDSLLSGFEREYPPLPEDASARTWAEDRLESEGQPSEEVLRMAAATTAAAARFRVRAAEAAKGALQLYDAAAKQAATAAQATTRALELQSIAEQHSASGNLAQALEAIREANKLRDESVDAARSSRQLQEDYLRQRREAQEAHAQADAAMRHAYSLERDALRSSREAAARDFITWRERYESLARQVDNLQTQAATWDGEAEAAAAQAETAQQQAEAEMAAGNFEAGNALMEEAIKAQEQVGYARAQASSAREAAQRLMPDVREARERLGLAEQQVEQLATRQAQLQDTSTRLQQDRLQEEAAGVAALYDTAQQATALHEELMHVYEDRLAQDQEQYDTAVREGRTADADALAAHVGTWRELLDVARQNRDTSSGEAAAMQERLEELHARAQAVGIEALPAGEGPAEGFEELRGAADRAARASQAAHFMARGLAATGALDPRAEQAGTSQDELLSQSEAHRQRAARLAQQLHLERQRIVGGEASEPGRGPGPTQAEALLDSVAVTHLVGSVEATRLLQLWKKRGEEANAGVEELRSTWMGLEQAATAQADEAVRLEEQALALEHAGQPEEASATMARADELHRLAEKLRLEADRAKAALAARERASGEAQTQSRLLLQGLHDVEHAAEKLQMEMGQRGYDVGETGASTAFARAGGSGPQVQLPLRQQHTAGLLRAPEGAGMAQDETATVMMASPSMLSRNSSLATVNLSAGMGGSAEGDRASGSRAYGYEGGGAESSSSGDGPGLQSLVTGITGEALEPLRRTPTFGSQPPLAGALSGSAAGPDPALAPLVQELESHSAAAATPPTYSWDGHDAVMSALEASPTEESALVSASSSSAQAQSETINSAGQAELLQLGDQERQARWQALAAALPAGADPVVADVVDQEGRRCATVAGSSSLLVETLSFAAGCHEALGARLSSYRRALAGQRASALDAASTLAEAEALQAQEAEVADLDAQLLAQVQEFEGQVAAFEAQGSTAQALTARFELKRLQNKHEDAAVKAGQVQQARQAARERAVQARVKEAEMRARVEVEHAAARSLLEALRAADAGVRHSAEGYSHAVSALTLGAQAGLNILRGADASGQAAEAEGRLDQQAREASRAQQALAEARRLREAAEAELAASEDRIAAARQRAAQEAEAMLRSAARPTVASTSAATGGAMMGPNLGMGGGAQLASEQTSSDREALQGLAAPQSHAGGQPSVLFGLGLAKDLGGFGVEDGGSALLQPASLSSILPSNSALSSDHGLQGLLALEAQLASLQARHQQELQQLREDRSDDDDAVQRRAVRQELEADLREAERQAARVRAEVSSVRDASPAEVQANNDRLQTFETRVAMLEEAIHALDELERAEASLRSTRAADSTAQLQARFCDEAGAVLAKALDACNWAIGSSQGAQDAEAQQRLGLLQAKAADFAQRKQDLDQEAAAARQRCEQAAAQLAAAELAAQLRREWLQQARDAAACSSRVAAWDSRLGTARARLAELQGPVAEQQDRARTSSNLAETMSSAVEQHRKQAAALGRQAADQRESSRRLAANGQQLEADAAKAMADSLQQQADGLLAQATQMEEDARKHWAEAKERAEAANHAHASADAQGQLVQQIDNAHRICTSALQWRTQATQKSSDACQKQAQAAEQQQQLAGLEKDLAALESQMSGGLRPDMMASHMISIARTKQQTSALRTSLRTLQQQLQADRDAAAAAAREAAKCEEELAQLEPRIHELEQEVTAGGGAKPQTPSTQAGLLTSTTTLDLPRPEPSSVLLPSVTFGHSVSQHPLTSVGGGASGPNSLSGGGEARRPTVRVVLPGAQLGAEGSGHFGLSYRSSPSGARSLGGGLTPDADAPSRLGLGLGQASGLGASPSRDPGSAPSPGQQLQRSKSASSMRSALAGSLPQLDEDDAYDSDGGLMRSPGRSGRGGSAPANIVNAPLARLRRGGGQRPPSLLGQTSTPASPSAGQRGASQPVSPGSSRRVLMHADDLPSDDLRSHRSFTAGQSASGQALAQLPGMPSLGSQPLGQGPSHPNAQGQGQGLGQQLSAYVSAGYPGGPSSFEGTEGAATAGDLLDRVAGKSLRPLSNISPKRTTGAPTGLAKTRVGSGGGMRLESASGGGGGGDDSTDSSESGGDGGDGKRASRTAGLLDGIDDEEALEEEEQEPEPDTKMYRAVKQRLEELEKRIAELRRQGDTANTAAEILLRKQEQLRLDGDSRAGSAEQQSALLSHGDAMIHLKEAEGSLCHKQADLLEEEAAACQDALQYALVDWRQRRELHRLEHRHSLLTGRAQALAVEAQGHEADAADAAECIVLANAFIARQPSGPRSTLEQQNVALFVEEQQKRRAAAQRHSVECRAGAARLATLASDTSSRKALCEEKNLCNKALYQGALELADAYEQAARISSQAQAYRLAALKAAADVLSARMQQTDSPAARDGSLTPTGSSAVGTPRGRINPLITPRSFQPAPEALDQVAAASEAAAEALQSYLEELLGDASDAMSVLRKRMDHVARLMQLHQEVYELGGHQAGSSGAAGAPSESDLDSDRAHEMAKRSARMEAARAVIEDMDRACSLAADLRGICVDAATAHGALCDAQTEPNTIQAQLVGHKDANLAQFEGEVLKQQQVLAALEVQVPLVRDQLAVMLQVVDYRQAAAQLLEARGELERAAATAGDAGKSLEANIAVHREALAMLRGHIAAVSEEARIFQAGGNVLQATAAEEAARRLAEDALSSETTLAALEHEARLKHDEQGMAAAAAEELQQVASASTELAALLQRIVGEQEEARVASRQVEKLGAESRRLDSEAKEHQRIADACSKQAEALQHQSLQCRTDLKFAAADSHLVAARQCRAEAQEHAALAAAAKQAAATAAERLKSAQAYRDQLLRDTRLLHTAAGHLQQALSCMRDKHHLLRKRRDVEHRRQQGEAEDEEPADASSGAAGAKPKVSELEVLQTQIAASETTIKHHLAAKASFVRAADHLGVSYTSLRRAAECSAQADAAMQEVLKARRASATTGTSSGSGLPVGLLAGRGARGALALASFGPASSRQSVQEATSRTGDSQAAGEPDAGTSHVQHAELRYRCLRGSLAALQAIAAAAECTCDARCRQVRLSDQAAILVSDLAAKILEAEANADEAAQLESRMRTSGGVVDEESEENLKAKLMVNALLQQAETYRGEAAALQGKILELEAEERAAEQAASGLEAGLERLRHDHRHTLEALDLTARIAASREHEAALRTQARVLSVEVAQLDREATGHEGKAVQLRQQLTNASHSADPEDVANLMVVTQQMGAKAVAHREQQHARKRELLALEAEYEQVAADVAQMVQRAEHVLRASETQAQVREFSAKVEELRGEMSAAVAACEQCRCSLEDLRDQHAELSAGRRSSSGGVASEPTGDYAMVSTVSAARRSHQIATTEAAISLSEQMLRTHEQRARVLHAAVDAWEAACSHQQTALRHQQQLLQQADWRTRVSRLQGDLLAAAEDHTAKARQLRAGAGKDRDGMGPHGAASASAADGLAAAALADPSVPGADVINSCRAQAAAIRVATDAAQQLALAEIQEGLASRASSLASQVGHQAERMATAAELVRPMLGRLKHVAGVSVSAARLQLVCVDACADQGVELTAMHRAMDSVRDLASRIQVLLEAADRHARAGQAADAAAARGQATALQEALQLELRAVQGCRQRLSELDVRIREAQQELGSADGHLELLGPPLAVAQSVAEYVQQACELHAGCAERQQDILRLARLAADAMGRAALVKRECLATRDAAEQLVKSGKHEGAYELQHAATTLERSLGEAEAERRTLEAQALQTADACGSDAAAAELYHDLASMSAQLLQHMDEQESYKDEHVQLEHALAALGRSLASVKQQLAARRGDMQALGGQIEERRTEALILLKEGHEAQAGVRREAAALLVAQLAATADDVVALERRASALQERHTLLASLHAKSEARLGMLGQLGRLCSAGVEHLLDAREAHEQHAQSSRAAALLSVELSQAESELAAAEARVSETQRNASQMQHEHQQLAAAAASDGALAGDDDAEELPDPEQLLQAAGLARAELLLARRQRGEQQNRVAELRSRAALAEITAESSQLRVSKARERAEEGQRLVASMMAVLEGSGSLLIDADALRGALSTIQGITSTSSSHNDASAADGEADQRHGIMSAAQLQSVILQALAEAASKFVDALSTAGAAEAARADALTAAQEARAAREAAGRQQVAVKELTAAEEGASLAATAGRLPGRRRASAGPGSESQAAASSFADAGLAAASSASAALGSMALVAPQSKGPRGRVSAELAKVELERLHHEAAYMDATAAQQLKLVACLEQQCGLLRRTSDSLLEMARYGVGAELNAGPRMTADEAATLLAACKQLSLQHVATLALTAPLERCQRAEACLRASLECVDAARRSRMQALEHRVEAIQGTAASSAPWTEAGTDGAGPGLGVRGEPVSSVSYSPSRLAAELAGMGQTYGRTAPLYPTAGERAAAATLSSLAAHEQLLTEEEALLGQVQELEQAAAQLRDEAEAQAAAFEQSWAAASRPAASAAAAWLERAAADGAVTAVVSVPRSAGRLQGYGSTAATTPTKSAAHSTPRTEAKVQATSGPGLGDYWAAEGADADADDAGAAAPQRLRADDAGELLRALQQRHEEEYRAWREQEQDQRRPAQASPLRARGDSLALHHQPTERPASSAVASPQPGDGALPGPSLQRGREEEASQGRYPTDGQCRDEGEDSIDADLLAMASAAVARAKAAAAVLAARERLTAMAERAGEQAAAAVAASLGPAPAPSPSPYAPPRSSLREQPAPHGHGALARPGHGASVGVAAGSTARYDATGSTRSSADWSRSQAGPAAQPPIMQGSAPASTLQAPALTSPSASVSTARQPVSPPAPSPPSREPAAAGLAAQPQAAPAGAALLTDMLRTQPGGSGPPSGTPSSGAPVQASRESTPVSSAPATAPAPQPEQPPSRAPQPGTSSSTTSSPGATQSSATFSPGARGARPAAARQPAAPSRLEDSPTSTLSSFLQPPSTDPSSLFSTAQHAPPQPQPQLSADPGLRPGTPALPRLPLPDVLTPCDAAALAQLWAVAATHYQRQQAMHDGAISALELQWERCQAQLQVLWAEEQQAQASASASATADRRGAAADAASAGAAAARWQARASHLHAAMQKHAAEAARCRARWRRATSMGERLHLLAPAGGRPTGSELEPLAAVVPRLPAAVLASCAAVGALERLQGDLAAQAAALQTVATGLQQQSERLFAKASERSGKARAKLDRLDLSSAHPAALAAARSHLLSDRDQESLSSRALDLSRQAVSLREAAGRLAAEGAVLGQASERLQRAADVELAAQDALVQAVDLALCEAMGAVLFGQGAGPIMDASQADLTGEPGGELDALLAAGHAPGFCGAAARAFARRGEDLATEAQRAVQGAREVLEGRLAPFARCADDVAGTLGELAAHRSVAREQLLAQAEAATMCVARARAKWASRTAAGDAAAADKYARAAAAWSKQESKLRREAQAAAAGAEDLAARAQGLHGMGPRLRPMHAALEAYLDEQLEAWAAAALSRVHQRGR
ncbi:hypothetical protein HYH03_000952 [Edaphochlamys debaryana]|uniref:Uncharacterized protein n=1 Tax=Edaphochlamys debaryana TaxID=47281 RepID=A0A835YG44_9CHLO|nr:hypothetical protein HYH03_000952 [Edaphochlamys debaryana]|eukprot:KAG2501134.1 hypothetical protein HYH03_000952 [Edaphochlamys debaryana]